MIATLFITTRLAGIMTLAKPLRSTTQPGAVVTVSSSILQSTCLTEILRTLWVRVQGQRQQGDVVKIMGRARKRGELGEDLIEQARTSMGIRSHQ